MAGITIYEALENWKNREQNFGRLFSEQTLQSRHFMKAKLDHYRQLNDKFGRQKEMKGDLGLKLLRGEIRNMERLLFPNITERLLRRFQSKISIYFGSERLLEKENNRINASKENSLIGSEQKSNAEEKREQQSKDKALKEGNDLRHLSKAPVVDMSAKKQEYLTSQLKQMGFSESLLGQLNEKMQKQEPHFTLISENKIGKEQTTATLSFKKPDNGLYYVLDKYNLLLKNQQYPGGIKQTFSISPGKDNINLNEAYNLLNGRAVYKELVNQQGEKYNAWLQLDFKETNKQGDFKMKQFHQNYGFDLRSVLEQHPIKGITTAAEMQQFVESLEKGNRQAVTVDLNGTSSMMFIEANPQFKTLNVYDSSMNRVQRHELTGKDKDMSQKQNAKQGQKQGAQDDGEPEMGQQKQKRRGQRIT